MTRAFTLSEFLIVIAIIAILSVIVFPYYHSARQQLALQRAASKLAQDIRRAQEMAMSTKEFGGAVPEGGYGIYFDQTNPDYYIIYADSGSPPKQYQYTSGEEIETIDLEEEIEIDSVTPPKTSINFRPPDPITDLKDNAGTDHENVTITIGLKTDPSKTKTIRANKAGLIYVE